MSTWQISIHALLAESDGPQGCYTLWEVLISIHALLAESDQILDDISGATSHFYPRSPCGERLFAFWTAPSRPLFLSTLSLRRATVFGLARLAPRVNFYPRSPCGERRQPALARQTLRSISIHALLAESDRVTRTLHPASI